MDIITINAMITGYINNNNYSNEALNTYNNIYEMYAIKPDTTTHCLAIKIIHKHIKNNILEQNNNIKIRNISIDFYGNCDDIYRAANILITIVSIGSLMN